MLDFNIYAWFCGRASRTLTFTVYAHKTHIVAIYFDYNILGLLNNIIITNLSSWFDLVKKNLNNLLDTN